MKPRIVSRLARRFFASLLGLLLSVVVAEVVIRIVAPQEASWLDIYKEDDTLGAYSLLPDLASTIETGEGRWHVFTDHRGRRVEGTDSQPATGPWLLALGDSYAFGYGVEYEASFVGLLAARLSPRCAVVNASVPGYGPIQYRRVLESYLAAGERPTGVLLSIYVGNDFMDCFWSKRIQVIDGARVTRESPWRVWLKRHSHAYRLASNIYQRFDSSSSPVLGAENALYYERAWNVGDLASAYSAFESELHRIAAICSTNGIRLAAVVIPTEAGVARGGPNGAEPRADYDLPVQQSARTLRNAGIPFEDLTAALRGLGVRNSYFVHNGHLTPIANVVAADAIWPLLQKTLDPLDH